VTESALTDCETGTTLMRVKGPDIYIQPPLTGKLEQQRFTM